MNIKLQITKSLSTEVFALMADWQEIRGHFYLGEHADNHFGKENLLDVLNAPGKDFVPFAQEDQPLVLIQRSRIVGMRPTCANSAEWPRMQERDDQYWPPARRSSELRSNFFRI